MDTRTRAAPSTLDTADLSPTGLMILRAATEPKRISQPRLRVATAVWMSLVFALCYVGLPLVGSKTGVLPELIEHLSGNTVAFVWLTFGTLAGLRWLRPDVVVPREGSFPTGPIVAATAASLAVWAVVQDLVFEPFSAMGAVASAMLIAFNVIESSLFGVMLATFARTVPRALAFGAAFQAVFVLLMWLWSSV